MMVRGMISLPSLDRENRGDHGPDMRAHEIAPGETIGGSAAALQSGASSPLST